MAKVRKPRPPEFYLEFVPPDHLTAIGNVITQWSIMEGMIENAIWQTSKLPLNIGRALTSQTQVQGKLDMLGAVLNEHDANLGQRFSKVADYIRQCLLGRRNTIAHGFWITNPDTESVHVFKFSAKGKVVMAALIHTPEEINELAMEIAEVTSWVSALSDRLPKLRKARGAPNHKRQDPPRLQDCANRKKLALQPLT